VGAAVAGSIAPAESIAEALFAGRLGITFLARNRRLIYAGPAQSRANYKI
jgi:hypothetical protein